MVQMFYSPWSSFFMASVGPGFSPQLFRLALCYFGILGERSVTASLSPEIRREVPNVFVVGYLLSFRLVFSLLSSHRLLPTGVSVAPNFPFWVKSLLLLSLPESFNSLKVSSFGHRDKFSWFQRLPPRKHIFLLWAPLPPLPPTRDEFLPIGRGSPRLPPLPLGALS